VQRTRKDRVTRSRSWTSLLLDDDRAHVVLELHAPVALVLAALADLSASS